MAIRYAPKVTIPASGGYQVVPAAGGAWHVYANGRRVFVKASGAAPAPAAAAPEAPPAPDLTPAPAAPEAAPVPKLREAYSPDAQYFVGQAQRLLRKQQALGSNEQQGVRNKNAYDEALRQMRLQQPQDEQASRLNANRQGLFYSSTLGNQLGDIARTYAERRSKTQGSFDESERARVAARSAIEQGYTVDDAAEYAASIDRQISRDTGAADVGALVNETPVQTVGDFAAPAAPAPARVAASAPAAAPRVVNVRRQPTTRARRPTARPKRVVRRPRRR